jgi:hypothetical protein
MKWGQGAIVYAQNAVKRRYIVMVYHVRRNGALLAALNCLEKVLNTINFFNKNRKKSGKFTAKIPKTAN